MTALVYFTVGAAAGAAIYIFGFRRVYQRLRDAPVKLAGRGIPLTPAVAPAGEHPPAREVEGCLVLDLGAVRAAVERAELRRRGVAPLAPRDPQREALEDRLLEMVERARAERAAAAELYPTSRRSVVALPINTKAPGPLPRPGA